MKKAKLSSILADEVESHKFERFPICIRSVDKNINIPEEFSAFDRCEQLSVRVIETEIMQVSKQSKRFDGASNMPPKAVGVGKQKQSCEKVVYTHCCGHNLNLVIRADCNIPVIQNTLDIVKKVTMVLLKAKFRKFHQLNPFLPSVSFLYILKISGNKKFSDVLRKYKKEIVKRKGLNKKLWQIISSANFRCKKSYIMFLKNCFVVAVCCYIINGLLINYAFRNSVKFP